MDCANNNQPDKNDVTKERPELTTTVPPEERRLQVLEFIAEHDIPLPPLAIYYGLVKQYNATYSYRTVQNILSELSEQGEICRVDTSALRDGEFAKLDSDDSQRRAYYFITEQGRDRL